ncbi:general transcription factor IIIA [Microdochium nivale]|nr:general transcription factor IIIA [Microdochium nivale]
MARAADPLYTSNMYSSHQEQRDFMLFPEQSMQQSYSANQMDLNMSPEGYSYAQHPRYDQAPSYTDAPAQYVYNSRISPGMYHEEAAPSSNLSTASVPSAPSSTTGSPNSSHGQLAYVPEPQHHVLMTPGIVGHNEYFAAGADYAYNQAMEEYTVPQYEGKPTFVDPSLIHPEIRGPMAPQMQGYDTAAYHSPQNMFPHSPAHSEATSPAPGMRLGSQSPPYMQGYQQYSPYAAPAHAGRRQSLSSYQSHEYIYGTQDVKDKQQCPHPDCGKIFKDLKAHMLTHMHERPEKCPILTCDYHTKGFARKYDKNRHTLTHYKGTMVCGFCPGSGSAAEKSFNRADVFKRHLTAVHGVEQTPPNSRKKSSASGAIKKLPGYAADATGKCSTCSATFSNAQDFYEHLDDCVLRIVVQEDPSEAINAKRLGEVENDLEVVHTLEKNQLPITTQTASTSDMDEDDYMGEESDEDCKPRKPSTTSQRTNPSGGVQKARGMTQSRGGKSLAVKSKSRKHRRDYPSSWGFDKGQMTMKKRVITVFDGPRRLAKDDMMLSTDHEVRIKLSDGQSYVTDLDINSLKRAEGFHGATEEEKGIWISDDPTEEDMARMLAMSSQH